MFLKACLYVDHFKVFIESVTMFFYRLCSGFLAMRHVGS